MSNGALIGRRFETEVQAAMKHLEPQGFYGHKLPVGHFERYMKSPPFDFEMFYQGTAAAVECKAMAEPGCFAYSRLQLNQEVGLKKMAATGNRAFIMIGIMKTKQKQVWAIDIETYLKIRERSERKSLTLEELSVNGRYIDFIPKVGWDLRALFSDKIKQVKYITEEKLPIRSTRCK